MTPSRMAQLLCKRRLLLDRVLEGDPRVATTRTSKVPRVRGRALSNDLRMPKLIADTHLNLIILLRRSLNLFADAVDL
jgi:hypothetical protein